MRMILWFASLLLLNLNCSLVPHPALPQSAPNPRPVYGLVEATLIQAVQDEGSSGFDIAPEFIEADHPVYPRLALEAGVEGTVIVEALIGEDGSAKQVQIAQSVPFLDSAALASAQTSRFNPARLGGKAVRAWMVIPIRFILPSNVPVH